MENVIEFRMNRGREPEELIYGPCGHLGPLLHAADCRCVPLQSFTLSSPWQTFARSIWRLRAQLAFMLRLMSLPAAGCCLLVVAAMARVATHFEFLEGKSYSKTCLLSTQSQIPLLTLQEL